MGDFEKIKKILDSENTNRSILVYTTNGTVSKLKLEDDEKDDVFKNFEPIFEKNFLTHKDNATSPFETADKDALYCVEFSQDWMPFNFLKSNVEREYFSEENLNQLKALFIQFALSPKENVYFLQMKYAFDLLGRRSGFLGFFDKDDVFKKIGKRVLFVDDRIDAVIVGGKLYCADLKLLVKYWKFEEYENKIAQEVVKSIKNLELISNFDVFFTNKNLQKYQRKLSRLKDSDVLKLPRERLVHKIGHHHLYKTLLSESKKDINVDKGNVNVLFKMLGDDFLKSDLTGLEYDSSVKKKMG